MRVGIYVDAFNLYYGGRKLCGRSTPGWRWLDLRALAKTLVAARRSWTGAQVSRVVYCTALISQATNRSGFIDQDVYLKALKATGAVDLVELGHYVARVKQSPLAVKKPGSAGLPEVVRPGWPVVIQDGTNTAVTDATFIVSHMHREEKGSDVNVASHLLVDVLTQRVDAVVLISNDSDLRLPIELARSHIPVGVVNPSPNRMARALQGQPYEGVGNHWWGQLTVADFKDHQLPDPAGGYRRPADW